MQLHKQRVDERKEKNAFVKSETYLDQFEKSKADYIDFKKMPVVFNDAYKTHARIYYTAESLGNLDVMHRKIFKAMHLDRKSLMDEKRISIQAVLEF